MPHDHHNHTADAATPVEIDWAAEVAHLQEADALFLPMREQIAAWLAPAAGAQVLDAGCGTGGMTVPLARAVGPSGRVLAVDGEPAALAALRAHLDALGLGGRVETIWRDLQPASPGGGPAEAGANDAPLVDDFDDFDLVWASHAVHHLPDQAAAVGSMAGWLRPGGRLALAEGGLPMRCLPLDIGIGEPGLQDRVEAAFTLWFNAMRASIPGAVPSPHGWPRLLRDAGLVQVRTRSFLFEAGPPLEPTQAAFVRRHLEDSLERVGDLLDEPDRLALARLCNPDDPAYVEGRDDIFVLTAESVHVGTRPG